MDRFPVIIGTTSCCVLAAELLREAEKLVTTNRVRIIALEDIMFTMTCSHVLILFFFDTQIHPQTVVEGYRIASHVALKALQASAKDHSWVWLYSVLAH